MDTALEVEAAAHRLHKSLLGLIEAINEDLIAPLPTYPQQPSRKTLDAMDALMAGLSSGTMLKPVADDLINGPLLVICKKPLGQAINRLKKRELASREAKALAQNTAKENHEPNEENKRTKPRPPQVQKRHWSQRPKRRTAKGKYWLDL